jgi:phosphatidylglycerol---prolipoprotein diacylglyceryl transferase
MARGRWPTPIYETLAMGFVAYLLWRLRDRYRPGVLFAIYLVLAGLERFAVEFIRRNPDVAIGLTQAQLLSVGMFLVGGAWLGIAARRGTLARAAA